MTMYVLRKTCTRGRKGDVVDVRLEDVAPLQVNGIIDKPVKQEKTEKVTQPELTKIIQPNVKKRGRRASNAAN